MSDHSVDWASLLNQAAIGQEELKPIPGGVYDIEITRADVKPSKAGKTMYTVICRILLGPNAGKTLRPHNFTVSPESPKAMFIFFRDMATLGMPQNWFTEQRPSPGQVALTMVGKRASVTVTLREFPVGSGLMVNDIASWGRPSPAAMSVPSAVGMTAGGFTGQAPPAMPAQPAMPGMTMPAAAQPQPAAAQPTAAANPLQALVATMTPEQIAALPAELLAQLGLAPAPAQPAPLDPTQLALAAQQALLQQAQTDTATAAAALAAVLPQQPQPAAVPQPVAVPQPTADPMAALQAAAAAAAQQPQPAQPAVPGSQLTPELVALLQQQAALTAAGAAPEGNGTAPPQPPW